MRQFITGLVLNMLVFVIGTSAVASSAAEGSFGPHGLNARSGMRSDVCYFCHTPQGRQSDGPGWEVEQQVSAFDAFDTHGPDGNIGLRGSVSVACLSCHDGSQAPDVAVNTPYQQFLADIPIPRKRMAGDHPVGVVFSGYGADGTASPAARKRLQRGIIGSEVHWWLDMEAVPDGVRDKTDVIFYTRGEGAGMQPFIECASCHDPHANSGNMFLRTSTAGSNLCQACHSY
jgi:predicted CXXCH cytochrome family protein